MKIFKYPKKYPFTTALFFSAAMQLAPQTTSSRADDYLENNDFPESLAENFDTDKMRVYNGNNPLYYFHVTGRPIALLDNKDRYKTETDEIIAYVALPFSMLRSAFNISFSLIPPYDGTRAFAIPDQNGTCFIKPTSNDFELKDLLGSLSQALAMKSADSLNLQNDQVVVQHAIRTFIIAHEMRHCDQSFNVAFGNMNEIDADLEALKVLAKSGYSESVLSEVYSLLAASRLVGSMGEGISHDTGLGVVDGEMDTDVTLNQLSATTTLSLLVDSVLTMHTFPELMDEAEKKYHTVAALNARGYIKDLGDDVNDFASKYLQAYRYLNDVSNNLLIENPGYARHIDVDFLNEKSGSALKDVPAFTLQY